MTTHRSQKLLFKCVVLGVLLLVTSCTRPPLTDEKLITSFRQNRAIFVELASALSAADLNCAGKDPSICVLKGSPSIENKLKLQSGLPIQSVYVKRNLGDSLWVPVQTYGPLSMSSSTRGYVYCKCSLEPLTRNTIEALGQGTNGIWYRPIENGWMLFAAR